MGQCKKQKEKRKDVWAKIAKEMENHGYKAKDMLNKVEQKWRNLERGHKDILDNKKRIHFCLCDCWSLVHNIHTGILYIKVDNEYFLECGKNLPHFFYL